MRERNSRRPTPAASREQSRRPQLLGASYRAGARILRAVPPGVRHAAAAPGGAAWYWLSSGQRHAALENYAAALGRRPTDPEVARVARRALQNYGRMLMDFLLIGSLTPDELVERVTLEGREDLEAALARDRAGRPRRTCPQDRGCLDAGLPVRGRAGSSSHPARCCPGRPRRGHQRTPHAARRRAVRGFHQRTP